MFKGLLNKLADCNLAFYDKGSRWLAKLRLAALSTRMGRWFSKPAALVFLELFVAICLTVNFYYLVRPQCAPKKNGNMFSGFSFTYLWNLDNAIDVIPENWRTRLLAPTVSSWFVESQITPLEYAKLKAKYPSFGSMCTSAPIQHVFGMYHAAWLFLLFLILIYFRKDALLLILGVFAGLMYNMAEPAGMYYYPWDMPAMFFFALACLLFDRGWIWLLLPAIVLGGLFKETLLCSALLVLLGGHWNWTKRIIAFVVVVAATLGLNRLLMAHYGIATQMQALNGSKSVSDLFQNSFLFKNLQMLFSLDSFHVIFANAGALFLMMLVPWRNRRDVLFKLMIVIFAAGQFMYGVINEVRVWYELLPLGWMLVSESITRNWSAMPANAGTRPGSVTETARRLRAAYWTVFGGMLVLALGGFFFGKLNVKPTKTNAQIIEDLTPKADTGDAVAQFDIGHTYEDMGDYNHAAIWYKRAGDKGHADAQYDLALILAATHKNDGEALAWYQLAAAQGHRGALYRLGVIYWDGIGAQQDPAKAFEFFLSAAQLGEVHAQWLVGKIYKDGYGNKPNLVEAYRWSRLAMFQGHNAARKQLNACKAQMSAKEIADAEAKVKEFLESQK